MKKLLNKPKTPIFVAFFSMVLLLILMIILIVVYNNASANLSKQQQWSSGKESFDQAYAIAASVKDVPYKNLYVPKLIDQIGKTVPECITSIGMGATEISVEPVNDSLHLITESHVINLNNESGNVKAGTPNIVAYTDVDHNIRKISFSCNAFLLGYGDLSFIDLIDNEHAVEKTFSEAGLNLPNGTVNAPVNRASYTQYASDGTTVVSENCSFNGTVFQEGKRYKWESSVKYDYTYANLNGNLADTIRTITITISR